ncbi:uncharacterized protein [Cicer arietinum]|uniref:uncharacterized protein n=1 Tax=Cicer arietinum TaxID=3827 RepID=UPI003CC61D27
MSVAAVAKDYGPQLLSLFWIGLPYARIRNIQVHNTVLLGGFCLHSGLLLPTKFAPQDYDVRSAFGGFNLVRVAMIIIIFMYHASYAFVNQGSLLGLVISMELL